MSVEQSPNRLAYTTLFPLTIKSFDILNSIIMCLNVNLVFTKNILVKEIQINYLNAGIYFKLSRVCLIAHAG